jgi:threonine dehydratase
MSSSTLNRRLGVDIRFKCENLQRIGAFKFRGANNAMSSLSQDGKKRGVVTYSSGNHAQSVALVLKHADDIATVTEAAICEAVRFFFHRMKLVVESSGALGLAALLSGAVKAEGRVGVIVSGGNVDGSAMAQILNQGGAAEGL